MAKEIQTSAAQADILLYMVDAADFNLQREEEILKTIDAPTVFLLINKIDAVEKQSILPIIDECSKIRSFEQIIPICAIQGNGLDVLIPEIKKYLPEGPKYFPDDT